MYTVTASDAARRTHAATAKNTTDTSLNQSIKAGQSDAVSDMTVGELFRESAAQHLDPIKVLGGFSSFPVIEEHIIYMTADRRDGKILFGDDWSQEWDSLDDARAYAADAKAIGYDVAILTVFEVAP